MSDTSLPRVLLLAHCGYTTTTALLFDVVDGAHRFVGQGNSYTTLDNLKTGVQLAIDQLGENVRRVLLDEQGELITPATADEQGVDYFGLTLSAAGTLNAIVVGLLDEVSLSSAQRVLHSTYTAPREQFSLADQRTPQVRIDAIRYHRPDVILVTGGTDGGDSHHVLRLIDEVSIGAMQLPIQERPQVIYAGNSFLREAVKERLANSLNVHMAENVRPQIDTEQVEDVQRVLHDLYVATKIRPLRGLENWGKHIPQPAVQMQAFMGQYLASLIKGRVFMVDVGSDTVSLMLADEAQAQPAVYSELGVGRGMDNLLRRSSIAQIQRWLVEESSPEELAEYIHNQALYPRLIPSTHRELAISQAVIRELLRYAVVKTSSAWQWPENRPPRFQLLVVGGQPLTRQPNPAQAVLMVLDAVQPTGVFAVAADMQPVLPALGYMARHYPTAAVQILEQGPLTDWGWVVVVTGQGALAQPALRLTLESERLGKYEVEVLWGALEVIPLPYGEEVTLTLRPEKRFDAGFGRGKKQTLTIHGGEVGLVIDARGRPLPMNPNDLESQRLQMRQWLWDAGG
ncbi:MAG: glutamate mutase L [Chloroflexi bacterium]|nr:glutamate mutase L [Chloroflexota bacterium]